MSDIGRWLILIGIVLAAVGALLWGLGRLGFRGLPGDIRIENDQMRFYFPIVTCVVVSLIGTGLLWLWRWLSGR